MKPGWYILLYHNISWEESPLTRPFGTTCPPDLFREHLEAVNQLGEMVSVEEGMKKTSANEIRAPLFSFWFDDGFAGVRRYAEPLLRKYQVTAAIAVCRQFWRKEDLFWRFKLAWLHHLDGMRFLRSKLRKHGYKWGTSVKRFTLDNFSEEVYAEIDTLYQKHTTSLFRDAAMNLFDTKEGLLELSKRDWILANHTVAHYPVGEVSGIKHFVQQFEECEQAMVQDFGAESNFLVVPFERKADYRAPELFQTFKDYAKEKYLVLVGNEINYQDNLADSMLYRINVPGCSSKQLIRLLQRARKR